MVLVLSKNFNLEQLQILVQIQTQSPGNSGCLLSGELNSTWLLITVTSPGTLEFSMGDLASPGCFDWIMWPYDANTCDDIFQQCTSPSCM